MQIFILVLVFLIAIMIAGRVILSKRDKKKEQSKPQKTVEELAKEEFEDRIKTLADNKIKGVPMATIFWYRYNVEPFINYVMREYNVPREQITVEELQDFIKVGVFWKL
ncbi:hypothetical protein [Fusobacterium phage Fnu1]|uniref:Uncharacterized protein n=1 Tax=Fusobacterium phage Fnu1 TaxID=2530024 RepID=A0A481W5N9_9CAUD|nr:hypothetical protein KMD24_gp055 [Fusobacterium phage Fnu1]QBJ04179.1 hypothetical protein [Fusobacterium phage Fnu1]